MTVTFTGLLRGMVGDPLTQGEIPSVFAPFSEAKAYGGNRFCKSCGECQSKTVCLRCRWRARHNGWCDCGAARRRTRLGRRQGVLYCPRGCGGAS